MTQFPIDIYNRILVFVYKKIGNPEIAQDVTQETFCRSLESLEKTGKTFESDEEYNNTLFKIARNYLIDWFRHISRYNNIISNENGYVKIYSEYLSRQMVCPHQNALDEEMKQVLSEAISVLTPRSQRIIKLRCYEGMKTKEIAKLLEMTDVAVRQVLTQSFATLRKNKQLCKYFQ